MNKGINEWATHLGLLYYSLLKTDGVVIELGLGNSSTPFLHNLCDQVKRELYSFDDQSSWILNFRFFERSWHKVYHDPSWKKLYRTEWVDVGVVLVDHQSPLDKNFVEKGFDERLRALEFFADKAKIIVVHDTQSDWFRLSPRGVEVFNSFKYAVTDKSMIPWTSAFSNFVDLEKDLFPKLEIPQQVASMIGA